MSDIIFFGTGRNARENFDKWIGQGLSPVCFADGHAKNHYKAFGGLEVLPLLEAIRRYPDYVLYCTQHPMNLGEIYSFLLGVGIPRERIKFLEDIGPTAVTAAINPLYPQMYRIYQALQDDLSRAWFWGRMEYSLSHRLTSVYRTMLRQDHLQWISTKQTYAEERYGLPALWSLLKENYPVQKNEIYLLAVDNAWNEYNWVVEQFLDAMPGLGIQISGCVMPYAEGNRKEFLGLPCLPEKEFLEQINSETRIIIGFPGWCLQTQDVVVRYAAYKDILYPIADTANPQYIEPDIFPPMENEIYVDVGVFDLQSSIDFSRWAAKGFEKIYAFEPDPRCYERSLARLNTMDDDFHRKVELIPKGLSSQNGVLNFPAEYSGSGVYDGRTIAVDVVSLDSFLNGKRVTWIKMDVEGSEMDVLSGMKETILKHKPRLAVCVYHKYEDLLTIASYLLGLVPEYKFFLRHYNSNETETVLFCSI